MATLASIVRALGGDLYEGGRRALVPGPGHGPEDRSVSLLLSNGRVIVHSFAGDDWQAVRDLLRERGLIGADGSIGDRASGTYSMTLSPAVRRGVARRLWFAGGPVGATLSETYCQRRGVTASSDALRHHSAVAVSTYAGAGPHREALLAAITDVEGEICGVEVTFLGRDGGRARMKVPRKTIGLRPAGSAVRLSAVGPDLLVGEGVFTCLSAAAQFSRPTWALLSTGNLRAWRPPSEVSSVLIAADRGLDGTRSAETLAARLRSQGVACDVRWPPAPFADWNDAACARRIVPGNAEP